MGRWFKSSLRYCFLPKAGPTVPDVQVAYLDHVDDCYSTSNEYTDLKLEPGSLSELVATMPAGDFGILQYRACRDWWRSTDSRSRQYINKQMKRMLRRDKPKVIDVQVAEKDG